MRAALVILVIVNLALLAAMGMHAPPAKNGGAAMGFNSEQISIVPLREGIRVVARCIELGPFGSAEAEAARHMLVEHDLAAMVSSMQATLADGWWVYLPPRPNHVEAIRRAKELERLGLRDLHVMEEGPNRHAISLGVFASQAAAAAYMEDLARRGIKGSRLDRQEQRVSTTLLYVRSQAPEVIARVTEVKAQFARAQMRQVSCPEHTEPSTAARVP